MHIIGSISTIAFLIGIYYFVGALWSMVTLAVVLLVVMISVVSGKRRPLVSKPPIMTDWDRAGIPYGYDRNNVPWRLDQGAAPAELYDREGHRVR
jgi:hypothetical protein